MPQIKTTRNIILFVMVTLFTALLLPRIAGADEVTVAKDKLHIYLCIGQSNMAGRAPYTEEDAKPIERCLLLNGEDQWEAAAIPLNKYSTVRKGIKWQKMNPSYMFAKTMLQDDKDITKVIQLDSK